MVILVHVVKASRFYLALYGQRISVPLYLKTYCKVTPISLLFPFKTGEVFRMYCYGRATGNMLSSIAIAVLDRFMDTVVLLTILVAMLIISGGSINMLIYMLLAFVFILLLMYFVFPSGYVYWKKYLLDADATVGNNRALRTLEYLNRIYGEVEKSIYQILIQIEYMFCGHRRNYGNLRKNKA